MPWRVFLPAIVLLAWVCSASAQTVTRFSILQAEDRRAPTPRDLAVLRAGARSGDPGTMLVAVRALGRLERPALIADILPLLKHPLPEVRAEAANAVGQAAEGWKQHPPADAVEPVARALEARLAAETAPEARGALCETLGRLPYTKPEQAARVERAMLDVLGRHRSVHDRLGVADGLELFVRRQRKLRPPSADLIAKLSELATLRPGEATSGARIRRLALEALITAAAVDEGVIRQGAADPDAQVRRLAVRAAGLPAPAVGSAAALDAGLGDDAAMVRLEAVRGLRARRGDDACPALVGALKDRNIHVDLMALDQLATCGASEDAVAALERTVDDLSQARSPRGWHRAAHALVALASAKPDRAAATMPQFIGSAVWQLRMYAARAAAILTDRAALDKLAADEDDNVREGAIDGSCKTPGPAASPCSGARCNGSSRKASTTRTTHGARLPTHFRSSARPWRRPKPQRSRTSPISTSMTCAAWPRRARASRFAASALSRLRCSPRKRRRQCCASRTSLRRATTTASSFTGLSPTS
jgi:hypothetical protein